MGGSVTTYERVILFLLCMFGVTAILSVTALTPYGYPLSFIIFFYNGFGLDSLTAFCLKKKNIIIIILQNYIIYIYILFIFIY